MAMTERLRMVAACGIDCGNCPLSLCRDDPALLEALVQRGIPRDRLPCPGCRGAHGDCPGNAARSETYECVQQRGVDYCFECADFPCGKLCPSSQRADVLPHNMKVFNLCTIRRDGVEAFVKASAGIERTYFKGKMEIGKGPRLQQG